MIVKNFLSEGEIACIRAAEKSGSSWFMLQMAVAFGCGRSCLTLEPTTALNVLFIDCDLLETTAAIRSLKIKTLLGLENSKTKWLGIRSEKKDVDLLASILENNKADLYFIDGLHWFGNQLDVFTLLRATGKTFVVSEGFRYHTVDSRPMFGYTPADSVVSLYPSQFQNVFLTEIKTRNYTSELPKTIRQVDGIFELDNVAKAKKHPFYKRWKTMSEEALWIISSGSPNATCIKERLKSFGVSNPKFLLEYMQKEGLIIRTGKSNQSIAITETGNALLKLADYDPTQRTVIELSHELFNPKEDEWFGPIIKDCPMPRMTRIYSEK